MEQLKKLNQGEFERLQISKVKIGGRAHFNFYTNNGMTNSIPEDGSIDWITKDLLNSEKVGEPDSIIKKIVYQAFDVEGPNQLCHVAFYNSDGDELCKAGEIEPDKTMQETILGEGDKLIGVSAKIDSEEPF